MSDPFDFDRAKLTEKWEEYHGHKTLVLSYTTPAGFQISNRFYQVSYENDMGGCVEFMQDAFCRHVARLTDKQRNEWLKAEREAKQ